MHNNAQMEWEAYCAGELKLLEPLLAELGFELDGVQAHISGERYLMSGRKLVLLGRHSATGDAVVIKASSEASGIREIEHERKRRQLLERLPFAHEIFRSPTELAYLRRDRILLLITRYIAEERSFLMHTLREQFMLALGAFKMQDGAHATASAHSRTLGEDFEVWRATEYQASFEKYAAEILAKAPGVGLEPLLARASALLAERAETIERYSGFLTHSDFVPHNMRIKDGEAYLLDQSSLRFGNKYESWARFLNYMLLYNRPLEAALIEYVRANRTPEELDALRLMRVYKLGVLLAFYARSLTKSSGNLRTLAEIRIRFWSEVLEKLLIDAPLPPGLITEYERQRDALRSPEEKERQRELGQLH